MSRRYRPDAGAGFSRLRDDPQLVLQAPAPRSFPAVISIGLFGISVRWTLKCTLRWSLHANPEPLGVLSSYSNAPCSPSYPSQAQPVKITLTGSAERLFQRL